MTSTDAEKVWDLADSSSPGRRQRSGLDLAGPIAAALAVVALAAAVLPGVPIVARWCLILSFGGVALLVGFSSLRHRQALASLLAGVAGVGLPLAAIVLAVGATLALTQPVVNRTLPEVAFTRAQAAVATSPGFAALSKHRRAEATSLVTSLVARLRTLHGTTGPFPAELGVSQGAVVERSGAYRGTALGRLPDDAHLVYSVAKSGSAFRITLVADDDPTAAITTDSTLLLPDSE